MLKKTALQIGLILIVLAVGCNQAPPAQPDTHDADVKAIKDTETACVAACATKDAQKVTSFYTDDASLLLPEAPVITGKDGILKAFQGLVTDPNFSLTFSSNRVDVAKSGELGYSQGSYTMVMSFPKSTKPDTEKGKYVTVWKKQADGSWKAIADMVSPDNPPAPAPKGK